MPAAHKGTDGSLEWGEYSEESHYATAGKPPSAASASAAGGEAGSKKLRKREATARKEELRSQQSGPSGLQEPDAEEEQQRLQVMFATKRVLGSGE